MGLVSVCRFRDAGLEGDWMVVAVNQHEGCQAPNSSSPLIQLFWSLLPAEGRAICSHGDGIGVVEGWGD